MDKEGSNCCLTLKTSAFGEYVGGCPDGRVFPTFLVLRVRLIDLLQQLAQYSQGEQLSWRVVVLLCQDVALRCNRLQLYLPQLSLRTSMVCVLQLSGSLSIVSNGVDCVVVCQSTEVALRELVTSISRLAYIAEHELTLYESSQLSVC